MIIFDGLHRVTPNELRVVATDLDSGRSHTYPLWVNVRDTAEYGAAKMLELTRHVTKVGLPPAYDAAADAAALRAEYNYPNHFRKAP